MKAVRRAGSAYEKPATESHRKGGKWPEGQTLTEAVLGTIALTVIVPMDMGTLVGLTDP